MAISILGQGKSSIRQALKDLVTHVVISDDTTAFATTQVSINPSAGTTAVMIGASTDADVAGTDDTFDSTMTVTGATQFTNKVINSLGLSKGTAVRHTGSTGSTWGSPTTAGSDLITRSVRSAGLGIGVQSGDVYTVGARWQVQDNS